MLNEPPRHGPEPTLRQLVIMRVYSLLGLVLLAIGIIGMWVPVLPTTIFLIGAAACFARSSPRLYAYLMSHPRLGPPLQHWFEEGAISKRGKATALFGMGIGMAVVVLTVQHPGWIAFAAVVIVGSGWYVMARPLPAHEQAQDEAEAAKARSEQDE